VGWVVWGGLATVFQKGERVVKSWKGNGSRECVKGNWNGQRGNLGKKENEKIKKGH